MNIMARKPKRSAQKGDEGALRMQIMIFSMVIIFLLFCFLYLLSTMGSGRRDEHRIEGLRALREALFGYYNENGYYPSSVSDWNPDRADMGAEIEAGANDYDNLASLISDFLPEFPTDPLNPANSPVVSEEYIYRYVSSSDGRNFAIVFETEDKNDDSPAVLRGW
ncbi:hypothetical protein GF382_00890 [Candidatus Falkowbacteria bacterium]|nr:hypothetical protein [Candidatus Falkowbacteria bacterium]